MPDYQPIQSLTISIPAYNDSQSLVKLVDEAEILCTRLKIPFQLLIINDGSHDDTLMKARELAEKYGNIEVISHSKNLGFGETLKKVYTLPKTEWVLFLPGDNQFPVSNLSRFLEIKDNYDYILGFRKERRDKAHRILYSWIYNRLISFFSGYPVRDVNSIAFYRSKIFDTVRLTGQSAFVHAEVFIRTQKANFRVVEMDIIHQEREFGFGSGGNIRVVANTITDLFRYQLKKVFKKEE